MKEYFFLFGYRMRPAQCLLRGISASSVPALLKLRSGSSFTHSNMDSFEALARTFSAIEVGSLECFVLSINYKLS